MPDLPNNHQTSENVSGSNPPGQVSGVDQSLEKGPASDGLGNDTAGGEASSSGTGAASQTVGGVRITPGEEKKPFSEPSAVGGPALSVDSDQAERSSPPLGSPAAAASDKGGAATLDGKNLSQSEEERLVTSSPPVEPQAFQADRRSPLSVLKKVLPLVLILAVVGVVVVVLSRFFIKEVPRLGIGKKDLVYWGLWRSEETMAVILEEWEKTHPDIKVNYEQHSVKDYRQRLQTAILKGEGPDIFRFHNSWTPMIRDDLEPIPASVMSSSTFEETFYPAAAISLQSGAGYLGIPLEIDTLALFYNQDFYNAAGVTPPRTWEEVRDLARRLTVRDQSGRIQRAGVAVGTAGNIWHWSDILGLMMYQNNVSMNDPTGSLAQDALTYYTLFYSTDKVWDDTLPESIYAFATGKTAMVFGYSWDVFEILNINPRLNFKIVPAPQLPGTDVAWASFWVEGVSSKSENKDLAWEFLQFLSSPEIMEKLYQEESKIRQFGEPYSRVDMADKLKDDPLVAPFISQAAKAKTWYLCSRTFDNGINDNIIKYYEDAVNTIGNQGNSLTAVETAALGVNQVLSRYGLVKKISTP